jgi:glycosyltransferase involved in cell wall biosynthesis
LGFPVTFPPLPRPQIYDEDVSHPGRPAYVERAARRPLVSVVVPTRDRAHVLHRALASILSQEYNGEIECLAVFDRTDPILPALDVGPSRTVRAIVNERTPGPAGARNAGALAARGEVLAFCDDDDEWLTDKLRLQVELLSSNPRAQAVSCGVYVSYGTTRSKRVRRRPVTHADLVRSRVIELNMTTLLVRRLEFISGVGLFDESIPGSYGEDYDWFLRATERGPVVIVPEPLVHIHWDRSRRGPESWHTTIAGLEYVLEKHPELRRDRKGLARIYGQIAFAHAALRNGSEARDWATRSLLLHPFQPRGYLATLASVGLAKPETIIDLANRFGRGLT